MSLSKLDFIDRLVWKNAHFIGVSILDSSNKTEGATTTWAKFWDPAFKAMINRKRGAYFRHVKLDEKIDEFKYVFINLKKDHPQYGWILMTSQKRLSSLSQKEWIQTTGKEEFHPNNNHYPDDDNMILKSWGIDHTIQKLHFKKRVKKLHFKKRDSEKLHFKKRNSEKLHFKVAN